MNTNRIFSPALFSRGQKYDFNGFKKDVLAGISVGVIAIPLCIAFGIKAGFTPAQGLLAGIISAIISAFLSGSHYQISGPTAACIGLTASLISRYGIDVFVQISALSGILLIVLGFLKSGNLVIYISKPIVIGFTTSIAISIFFGQLAGFAGIDVPQSHSFLMTVKNLFTNIKHLDAAALSVGIVSLAIIFLLPKKFDRIVPSSIIAMAVGAALTYILSLNIDTIGRVYGGFDMGLKFSFKLGGIKFSSLIIPALTLTLLIAFTSLLSSAEGDRVTFTRHNASTELISQGGANMLLSMFALMPTTGAEARTVTNIRAGAASQISNIIHALTLLMFAVVFKGLLALVPITSLAAILIAVSFRMIKKKDIKQTFKRGVGSWGLFVVTVTVALLYNLVAAVVIGIIIRLIMLYFQRNRRIKLTENQKT